MKKKFLALVCAMTMVVGMSMSVCAAGSSSASAVASTATAPTATSAVGQTIADTTLEAFDKEASVETTVAGATVEKATIEEAKTLTAAATKTIGSGAFIASIVDIKVPTGTGAAQFTLKGISNVWAGQKVTVLHLKADGTVEAITPDKVANNEVTFTLTSYSPVAIVVDTTGTASPKTRDIVVAMSIIAMLALCGATVAGRKVRQ